MNVTNQLSFRIIVADLGGDMGVAKTEKKCAKAKNARTIEWLQLNATRGFILRRVWLGYSIFLL